MDIKVVDQMGEEVRENVEVKSSPDTVIIPEGILLVERVAQVFDLKATEVSSYKDKLTTLIEYAKTKTSDHTPDGIKWALRSLGTKLGTPPLGEKLINYLHIYAKLYLQGKDIERKKEEFLRGEQD